MSEYNTTTDSDSAIVDDTNTYNNKNVAIAFLLVMGAGAATGLGAAVVFFPRLVQYANRRTLAAALGLSSGVMLYVSFVEILNKSTASFIEAGHAKNLAYVYSTACFFAGIVFMILLNTFVTFLLGGHHHDHHHDFDDHHHGGGKDGKRTQSVQSSNTADLNDCSVKPPAAAGATSQEQQQQSQSEQHKIREHVHGEETTEITVRCPCSSDDPIGDLRNMHDMAEEIEAYERQTHHHWDGQFHHNHQHHDHSGEGGEQKEEEENDARKNEHSNNDDDCGPNNQEADENNNDNESESSKMNHNEDEKEKEINDRHKLVRMSVNTALAIGLHNFPEGLATFVAALHDPSVGVVLAVAIAIHNIPEGLCVAMPVYYATGHKWKAFGWACLSGIAEPIAALLGYVVLAQFFGPTVYAVLFGMVAGMMVIISAKELLPTAHRYDPEDSVVTYSLMVGMAIMALSLVLFAL